MIDLGQSGEPVSEKQWIVLSFSNVWRKLSNGLLARKVKLRSNVR